MLKNISKKQLIVIWVVLAVFLSGCVSLSEKSLQELGKTMAEISILMMQYQSTICMLCLTYYNNFNKWPANKGEFEGYLRNNLDDKNKKMVFSFLQALQFNKDKEKPEYSKELFESYIKSFFNSINYNLSPLENNDFLVEGGFNEEVTKSLESIGFGKCFFSIICHKTKEGFSFFPSKKAEGSRDFLKMKFKVKT